MAWVILDGISHAVVPGTSRTDCGMSSITPDGWEYLLPAPIPPVCDEGCAQHGRWDQLASKQAALVTKKTMSSFGIRKRR